MEHVNVLHVDADCLMNYSYHSHIEGFDYCHKIVNKDQQWGGQNCLDVDMVYPVELKSVYYTGNKPFEILVCWLN